MEFIKKYYKSIVFFFLLVGIVLLVYTNEYELDAKSIEISVQGKSSTEIIHQLKPKHLILKILGQVCITFSIAIFISLFFIRNLEKFDREKLQKLMLKLQADTSKDAIESLFNRIIDKRFFEIIKEDMLSAKVIRKNATWKYDIYCKADVMILKRIISYNLVNISTSTATETLSPILSNSAHCKGKIVKCQIEHNNKKSDCKINIVEDVGFAKCDETLTIEPGAAVGIVIIMEQEFSNGYIYETHFTRHPIINLDIFVNFPSNFTFDLESSFSSKCILKIDEDGVKAYHVHGGIFKGQGVEFVCQSKPKQVTRPETTPMEQVSENNN